MLDHAISRASDWFNLHADQRLKLMNFYVILLAGALTLFGASIKDNNNLLEVVLGMSVAVITFTFKNLDRRTAYLVKSAEAALQILEKKIADDLKIREIELINAAEMGKNSWSYRQSFNLLFALGYFLSCFSLLHGGFYFWKILVSTCG